MELKLFSNTAASANGLSQELREKMEAKVLREKPSCDTKAAALEYLLQCAVAEPDNSELQTLRNQLSDLQEQNNCLVSDNNDLKGKKEALEAQNEYLQSELNKAKDKPAEVVKETVTVEVPQRIFDDEFYKYLRQVAFLVDEKFCPKNDVAALVKRVFEHYRKAGNFVFTAEDEKLLKENGLM